MLESRRIGGVTGDGNTHVFQFHYGYAFGNVVRAVALNVRSRAVAERFFVFYLNFFFIGVESGFYISEAVDTRNDVSRVFAEPVKDNSEGFNSHFVCVKSDFNSALRSGERFVPREEAEAFCFFGKKHFAEVAVT